MAGGCVVPLRTRGTAGSVGERENEIEGERKGEGNRGRKREGEREG